MNNDELMNELLKAKRNGETILYAPMGDVPNTPVEGDHAWDLAGLDYKIKVRREFIINVKGDTVQIEHPYNNWTRSDFGLSGDSEYILMREVYQDEM